MANQNGDIKTKIIVTYGPGLANRAVLAKVLRHADIVRLNFSHGDRESWLDSLENIRSVSGMLGKEIALLGDLPGPKIRVGNLEAPVNVRKGDEVAFKYGRGKGGTLPVEYPALGKDAKAGGIIDIGDGDARLAITGVHGGRVACRALNDGIIKSRKGISLLGLHMSATAPTSHDIELSGFAARNGFDYLGMSFVKSAGDIRKLRRRCRGARIIAKVEKKDAVANIDEIAAEADAIMIARGDLAFDVKLEYIPEVQRNIVVAARRARKPVIVATQLLASMVSNPMPTRAEVNDIANAVISGADCLMLSDETAVGKYPSEAVAFLVNTIRTAERITRTLRKRPETKVTAVNIGIVFAATELADEYKTDCIFVPTQTGTTARMISELRPNTNVIALSSSGAVRRSLSLYYGVKTLPIKRYGSIDGMLRNVREIARKMGICRYMVVSGSPNRPGSTDTLKYIDSMHE